MFFISNLNYVGVAVIGGYRVASGTMTLGDVQAFIQCSRQFTQPLTQIVAQMNLLAIWPRVGGTRLQVPRGRGARVGARHQRR